MMTLEQVEQSDPKHARQDDIAMAQTSHCLVRPVPKEPSRPPWAPTPLPRVSLVLPATTAPATAMSILHLVRQARISRATDRRRQNVSHVQ